MVNAKFRITKDSDWDLFNDITKKHEDFFEEIRNRLSKTNNLNKFVYYVLGDYLYDYNGSVVDDPDYQIDCYWNGQVSEYADCLKAHMSKARNIIFNIYFLYLKNKEDIENFSDDDIADTSADFYGMIGGYPISEAPKMQALKSLTIDQFLDLNLLLAEIHLEGFEPPKSTIETFLKQCGFKLNLNIKNN